MFLYTRKNVLSPELCTGYINTFEASSAKKEGKIGYLGKSDHSSAMKVSTDISFTPESLKDPEWKGLLNPLVEVVQDNMVKYIDRYSEAFYKLDPLQIDYSFNMQRYLRGEAFHGYHCESASLAFAHRVLVWMIYLNTVQEGGETEFYFQRHYEQAEQGKLVMWPADWTYLHRGVPAKETKYILTGWISYIKN